MLAEISSAETDSYTTPRVADLDNKQRARRSATRIC